jgi:serine/threonine protein phosphatase PrpC
MFADVLKKHMKVQKMDSSLSPPSTGLSSFKKRLLACYLVSVICGGMLYVACVGDSHAVLENMLKATGEVLIVQLSAEHNIWCVKGLLRCILYHLEDINSFVEF